MGQFGQRRGKKRDFWVPHYLLPRQTPGNCTRGDGAVGGWGGGEDPRIKGVTRKRNRLCEREASRRRVSPFLPVNTRHVSYVIRIRQTCPEFAVAASSKVQNARNLLCNYIRSYTCSISRRKPVTSHVSLPYLTTF
jgi:hypothetical protein